MSDDVIQVLLEALRIGRELAQQAFEYGVLLFGQAQESTPLALGLGVFAVVMLLWALRKPPQKSRNPYMEKDNAPAHPNVDIPAPDYAKRNKELQGDGVAKALAQNQAKDENKAGQDFIARAGMTFSHSNDVASRRQYLQDVESRLIELKTLYQSGLITLESYVTQSRQLSRK